MSAERARGNFGEELDRFVDTDFRDEVIEVFDKLCPEYFWSRPASKSGKYHPKFSQRNPGGLVIHSKAVARMAWEIARAEYQGTGDHPTPLMADTFLAAGIMHDMMKDGDPTRPELDKTAWKNHGVYLMQAIFATKFDNDISRVPEVWFKTMLCIATHMGIWTGVEQYRPQAQPTEELRALCTNFAHADYVISRKIETWIAELEQHQIV